MFLADDGKYHYIAKPITNAEIDRSWSISIENVMDNYDAVDVSYVASSYMDVENGINDTLYYNEYGTFKIRMKGGKFDTLHTNI